MRTTYTKGQILKCLRIPAKHHGYFTVGREYTVVEFDYNPTNAPLQMSCDTSIDLWCELSAFEDAKSDGGPAFGSYEQCGQFVAIGGGMSLRDYFAAKAMHAVIESQLHDGGDVPEEKIPEFFAITASYAYLAADAMLAERAGTAVKPADNNEPKCEDFIQYFSAAGGRWVGGRFICMFRGSYIVMSAEGNFGIVEPDQIRFAERAK